MNTYKIVHGVNGKFHIARGPREDMELFCGYDFMGSDNWSKSWNAAETFDSAEEAKQVISDLEAADEPAEREEPKMKLTKDQVIALNNMAQTNWERAQGMLDGMNAILGTKYGWLAKEVVWFEEPDADTARKYAAAHSAIAWTEE